MVSGEQMIDRKSQLLAKMNELIARVYSLNFIDMQEVICKVFWNTIHFHSNSGLRNRNFLTISELLSLHNLFHVHRFTFQ